ncbi:GNL3L/Grn1 putative GTPase-domain-containing protein [Neohortaea acidophila]|uniref:GNL3L/Grn1 putative GTPase-domain-containing protein n=1 Tax=Neohortaea acidophila TaxID=245834 RepID=A0A6A6PXU9_9PEZI|nr:GNL3L/Grn1 putative GTPase-domain-containing protein [Neohortaea acidophila]KAF2484323.1 GNL3L/Grn1 putative GTPase-domain-containing protein [Neohortaea acidophila]
MKVGKPKSKRVPVRLRQKIQKASAAKDRKRRKDAKKNPEWRSRLKKDPGIPNLFPYKAKVLAEIEESKRRKEEEMLRKREVAKAQRAGRAVEVVVPAGETEVDVEDDDEVLSDDVEGLEEDESMDEDDSNPMAALLASAQARANNYTQDDDGDDDAEEDEEEEEWTGVEEQRSSTTTTSRQQPKALPKQALADPIKSISKLLERVQDAAGGVQILLDYYQIPPLVTAGSDLTSRFLVEVARKRGRLGRGGVPNLHSAALTVLGDLNDERLVLPVAEKKTTAATTKGDVQVVERLAEPFRIEGLWGDEEGEGAMAVERDVTVQV